MGKTITASITIRDTIETPPPHVGKDGTWMVWDPAKERFLDTGVKAQGESVRPNLFTRKFYKFAQNNRFGVSTTWQADGTLRLEKVAKTQFYMSGASFYVNPIRDEPGQFTISFRVLESSRPIRQYYTSAVGKVRQEVGAKYQYTTESKSGRLPGFAFYWGKEPGDTQVGDYAVIGDIKIERVAEGESPYPTAYLPHPDDLKGKDVDPSTVNELRTLANNAKAVADAAKQRAEDTYTRAQADGVITEAERRAIARAQQEATKAKRYADSLVDITDTRDDNPPPHWYYDNYRQRTVREFKRCHVLGLSALTGYTYCVLETTVPWYDKSGGLPTQVAITQDGKEYRRKARSATEWGDWVDYTAEIEAIKSDLKSADTFARGLEKAVDLKLDKTAAPDVSHLLKSFKQGTLVEHKGIFLTNDLCLSDVDSKEITAKITGSAVPGAKSIRLGITYDGEGIDGGETTALANDGTGHLGDLYFGGDNIGFGPADRRYMQIGGTAPTESEMVNASTKVEKYSIAGTSVYKSGETRLENFLLQSSSDLKITASLSVHAGAEAQPRVVTEGGGFDGNPHYGGGYERPERVVYYDRSSATVSAHLRLQITRGGQEVYSTTSTTVTALAVAVGGRFESEKDISPSQRFDSKSAEQSVTLTVPARVVRQGDFARLTLVCSELSSDRGGGGIASASDIVAYIPRDTSKPMVSVTSDKASFFYGSSRYILFNYFGHLVAKIVGDVLLQGDLTLAGTLRADEVNAPGLPLCGGMVNENGTFSRSFGSYVNKIGYSLPKVEWDYSTKRYTVYHSFGTSSYIPMVTPVDHQWGDCLSVTNVMAYSFQVQMTNGNRDKNKTAFSYVIFRAAVQ